MEALGETWEKKEIRRENLLTNSDFSSKEGWESHFDAISVTEKGVRTEVTGPELGWLLCQDVGGMGEFAEESVTAYFSIAEYAGEKIAPVISFWDAEGNEIAAEEAEMASGKCTITYTVPVGTEFIRVGIYAWEGNAAGDFVTVDQIELYHGAFTVDTLSIVAN